MRAPFGRWCPVYALLERFFFFWIVDHLWISNEFLRKSARRIPSAVIHAKQFAQVLREVIFAIFNRSLNPRLCDTWRLQSNYILARAKSDCNDCRKVASLKRTFPTTIFASREKVVKFDCCRAIRVRGDKGDGIFQSLKGRPQMFGLGRRRLPRRDGKFLQEMTI